MNILKSFFAGLVIAAAASAAASTTINFDDPSFEGATGDFAVPDGYGGLNWDNVHIYDPTNNHGLSPSGYDFSVVSAPNVGFNAGANPITISSNTPFILNSVWLTSVWRDGLNVKVIGSLLGTQVYIDNFTPSATAKTLETFTALPVDSVEFIPSGGTQHPGYNAFFGTYFAMDDLNVDLTPLSAVPEPGAWVAAALALAVIAFNQRDRLSRAKPIRR